MEGPQRRQRTMLSHKLSAGASHELPSPTSASVASASSNNLRDLLTVRQEEDLQPLYQRRASAGVSLGTVIACEKRDVSSTPTGFPGATSPVAGANHSGSSRTLLDIIRDEESVGGGGRFFDDGFIIQSGSGGHKISWRAFKDRLRTRRASAAWQSPGTAAAPGDVPASDHLPPPPPAASSRAATHDGPLPELNPPSAASGIVEAGRPPTPAPIMTLHCAAPSSAEPEQGGSDNQGGAPGPTPVTYGDAQPQQQPPTPQPQQIRVSLMALLEQTDRQMEGPGFAVSALLEAAGEAEAEEEEEVGDGGDGEEGKMYKCCVCMVRHKGAAFIPCGHTFCRLCSRELWVSRGNCPLCNGFILEILDIF